MGEDLADGLSNWMDEQGFARLEDFRGRAVPNVTKWEELDLNYHLVATINPTGYPQVVEELTVSGSTTNLSKVYTYGLDLISQRQISGTLVTFYGYDGLGSVRFLTEGTGAITNTYAYDAYGTVIASNAPVANVYLYAGEQYDPDLGLYFLRARYYAPNAGRFWTMDDEEKPVHCHRLPATSTSIRKIISVPCASDAMLTFSSLPCMRVSSSASIGYG